uniref:Uncharacterized protein n=1 Tax=Vitis vinifera TaxID=29760 RepID=F6GTM5_VITVI
MGNKIKVSIAQIRPSITWYLYFGSIYLIISLRCLNLDLVIVSHTVIHTPILILSICSLIFISRSNCFKIFF